MKNKVYLIEFWTVKILIVENIIIHLQVRFIE